MKKIVAIVVISITVVVTAYNIYQNLPQFTVKPGTEERVEVKQEDRSQPDKGLLSAYIVFNLVCLIFLFIKYEIYKKHPEFTWPQADKVPTSFYKDALTDIGYGSTGVTSVCFAALCFVNGLVVFILLTWIVYHII